MDKVVELSIPVSKQKELIGILRTSLGRKVNKDLFDLLLKSVDKLVAMV